MGGDNIATEKERDYSFSNYLLVTDGYDYHDNAMATPDNWWSVYDSNFGAPLGQRYNWNGLIRRDFESAVVLVNEPQASMVTVSMGSDFINTNGQVCVFCFIFEGIE